MGKCLRKCLCLSNKKNELKIFNILILGLSGSGKTEIGHVIAGEKRKDYSCTNGVRKFTKKFDQGNCLWNITEIGGSTEMQKIWHHYFIKAIAIIYVIDMSDLKKISDGFNTLKTIVKNQYVCGKPIFVVVNKADLANNIDLNEIEEIFELELLANTYKSPMLLIENHKFDLANFLNGLNWLQSKLLSEYRNLSNRIKFDSNLLKNNNLTNKELLKTANYNTSRPSTAPSRLNKITQNNKFKNIRLRRIHAKENISNNENNNDNHYNNVNKNFKMDNIIINPTLPATSVKTIITLNNNNSNNNKTNVAIVTIETMEHDGEVNYDKSKINNNENGFYKNSTTITNNRNNTLKN